MIAMDNCAEDLKRQHPEWGPWLAVIQEILNEIAEPKWDAMVPSAAAPQASKIPLLAQVTLEPDRRSLARIFDNLMRIAGRSGAPKMATLQAAPYAGLDVLALLQALLNQDDHHINKCASVAGVDPEAFRAVAALLPMPLLYACNRRWKSYEGWMEGYCPICGAWPAYAEVRGIERSRYFRCAGCGSEWQAQCLFCPYCGMTDHRELASLVPEQSGSNSAIDACNRCRGYVKAFTKLQGSPPARIIPEDLASVALDVAAADRGYRRPRGAGYSLNLTLTSRERTTAVGVNS
jgi:FdhE protein